MASSNANPSSLLASADELSTPLLSATDALSPQEEESELSRIIRHSAETRNHETAAVLPAAATATPRTEAALIAAPLRQKSPAEASFIVVAAGTLTILQCGWVWTSYLASSWSDTYLHVDVAWQRDYLPSLDNFTDKMVRTTDLGSILAMLHAAKLYGTLALLGVTAVGLPCLSMCLHPTWIVDYYSSYYQDAHAQPSQTDFGTGHKLSLRPLIEWTLRFSFIVIYLLVLLDLAVAQVTLEWTDTIISIHNRTNSGLISYVLGMTAALAVVVTLRSTTLAGTNHADSPASGAIQQTNDRTFGNVHPPQSAFRYPWTGDPTYSPLLNERDPERLIEGIERPQSPALYRQASASARRDIGRWRRFVVWEAGLLSGILLVSSFTLPLFQLQYSGLASQLMSETQVKLYLWQIPWSLWTHGDAAGTDKWMLVLSVGGLVLYILILPVTVLLCGIVVWTGPHETSRKYLQWLYCLAPTVNGITFVATVLVIVPSLGSLMDYLLQEGSSGLCDKFKVIARESCLEVTGTVRPGTWSMLGHAVALEVFTALTLWYAK